MAEEGFWARRWKHVVSEWRVILQAKTLFGSAALLLIAGTAIIVWKTVASLDAAEIAGLKATIGAEEATIRFQDIRLKSSLPASTTAPPPASSPDIDYSNLRPLSNAALRKEVGRLAGNLREMEAAYENALESATTTRPYSPDRQQMQKEWEAMSRKTDNLRAKENYEWQTLYRGRVAAIYEELSRRLGISPIGDSSLDVTNGFTETEAISLLKTGMAMFHLTFPTAKARMSMVKRIGHAKPAFRRSFS